MKNESGFPAVWRRCRGRLWRSGLRSARWLSAAVQVGLSAAVAAGSAVIFLAAAAGAVVDADADSLERRAFEVRRAVESYDVSVTFRHPVNPHGIRWVSARYYFDGTRIRCDHTECYSPADRFDGLSDETYRTVNIYKPEEHICFSFQELPEPLRRAVEVDRMSERVRQKYDEALVQHDIRALGFHPSGLFPNMRIDDMLRSMAYPEREVAEEYVNGRKCTRISLSLTSGVRCCVWMAPDAGCSIVRCTSESAGAGGVDVSSEVDLEVKEWRMSGLWFPVSYDHVLRIDGEVYQRDCASLRINSLNEPLPADTFELAGIGIPPGRSVVTVPSDDGKAIWDGKAVVYVGERRRAVERPGAIDGSP